MYIESLVKDLVKDKTHGVNWKERFLCNCLSDDGESYIMQYARYVYMYMCTPPTDQSHARVYTTPLTHVACLIACNINTDTITLHHSVTPQCHVKRPKLQPAEPPPPPDRSQMSSMCICLSRAYLAVTSCYKQNKFLRPRPSSTLDALRKPRQVAPPTISFQRGRYQNTIRRFPT